MAKTMTKIKEVKTANERTFHGRVVSANEKKTVHVLVESIKTHPKYRKQYSVSRKYAVHDEKNEAKVGNMINFVECRPMSRTKRWKLVNIVK